MRRVAISAATSTVAPMDMRGRHRNRPCKITPAILQKVKDHIKSLPIMKSHYSRNKSKRRQYLSPHLSIAGMHQLYLAKYDGTTDPLVTYSRRYSTNVSTCRLAPRNQIHVECASNSEIRYRPFQRAVLTVSVKTEHKMHLCSAEKFYASLRVDTELAKESIHLSVITFDFQQNLPLPQVPVGDLFYLHQLWVYVFGVHSCSDNQATMLCWPETVAKRGSDEVISCLHTYLSNLPAEVTSLRLYSDGCGGQNKNANVLHYLFCLAASGRFKHISHTFPVRGCSFLPNDRDFGRTEVSKTKHERV